jgi:uncharacterized circularly permuted ATP-grasp superfamily protein
VARQAELIARSPERWIAQELVELSVVPTARTDGSIAPRRVDLRPFAVFGESVRLVPGGLTRVALEEGSMVVNSSRGGGSKDTWVLADHGEIATEDSWLASFDDILPRPRQAGWVTQVEQQQQERS